MADKELDRLREEARKSRAAVTAKIGRMRRDTGLDITGRREDPRRPLDRTKKLNKTQLKAYIREMSDFRSRDSGYVQLGNGELVTRAEWNTYARAQIAHNQRVKKHEAAFANVPLPGHEGEEGLTVGERLNQILPKTMSAHGSAVNRPLNEMNRKPMNIANREALQILTKDLKAKRSPDYLPEKLAESRAQAVQMLNSIGMSEAAEKISALNDDAFNILWNYTKIAKSLSLRYEIYKSMATGTVERWYEAEVKDEDGEVIEILDWAGKLTRDKNGNFTIDGKPAKLVERKKDTRNHAAKQAQKIAIERSQRAAAAKKARAAAKNRENGQ